MSSETKTWDIDAIVTANRVLGFHFFSADTKRFFRSRIGQEVYQGAGGVYFVTSERGPVEGDRRRYTVRQFLPETGNIKTIGDFNQLSKSAARNRAANLAKGDQS
jgi:hypothetical protein